MCYSAQNAPAAQSVPFGSTAGVLLTYVVLWATWATVKREVKAVRRRRWGALSLLLAVKAVVAGEKCLYMLVFGDEGKSTQLPQLIDLKRSCSKSIVPNCKKKQSRRKNKTKDTKDEIFKKKKGRERKKTQMLEMITTLEAPQRFFVYSQSDHDSSIALRRP